MILDADHYKATVNTPPGTLLNCDPSPFKMCDKPNDDPQHEVGVALDDDEFFHATCHVDPQLKTKIEKGLFVDLDRLLPKSRFGNPDDTEMKLVFREGKSYFVPVQSQNKINSVRKWEQVFCIYAAIYSQANPQRSAEI